MTETSAPPVFLEGDLGWNGGKVVFATVGDFVEWAETEKSFWKFLTDRHKNLEARTLARTIADHISQITVHGGRLANGEDAPDAEKRLKESFEAYRSVTTLHSSNPAAARVKIIHNRLGLEGAIGALEAVRDADYSPSDRPRLSGAVAYIHLAQFGEIPLGSAEVDALRSSIETARAQTSNLIDDLRADQRRFQESHDAGTLKASRLSRKALQAWRRFRTAQTRKSEAVLAKLEATERGYSVQMQLQAPVEYWAQKRAEHDLKASNSRKVLVRYFAWATVVVALLAIAVPFAAPLFEGKALLFSAAAAGALLTMMFWAGRVLVRLYLSELHLAGDAWERATMAKTYLALTKEGHAAEDDRVIILGALFRQSSDGVVKEDAAPDPSALAMLARLLDRKP